MNHESNGKQQQQIFRT